MLPDSIALIACVDDSTFTDADWDALDRLELALELHGDLTASAAGRKVGLGSREALGLLRYLVDSQFAHTSGNGAWTHFHPGRVR